MQQMREDFDVSKKIKSWPCGCDVGNPWHYDCKDKRCKAASSANGESLGVSCLFIPCHTSKSKRKP